jgi:hypothetical protein
MVVTHLRLTWLVTRARKSIKDISRKSKIYKIINTYFWWRTLQKMCSGRNCNNSNNIWSDVLPSVRLNFFKLPVIHNNSLLFSLNVSSLQKCGTLHDVAWRHLFRQSALMWYVSRHKRCECGHCMSRALQYRIPELLWLYLGKERNIYGEINFEETSKWCKIWVSHVGDYEECRLLGYRNPVRSSQETHYVSATAPSRLMLFKLWGFHVGDYAECRFLGYIKAFPTSQETLRFNYGAKPINAV